MQNFEHLITTKPHDIHAVFIADLHLSENTSRLNYAFLALLNDLIALPNLHSLYILGDWLDAWIGDDDYLSLSDSKRQQHWLTPILNALTRLSQQTQIYVMHGNRDFAIRQGLLDTFGGKLIHEPYILNHIRLEHGDALCTDDVRYQRYRKIIRNPLITWLLLKQPLAKRRKLAQKIKHQATADKHQKPASIMDVNDTAVKSALQQCCILIHGHTHRPALHTSHNKQRLVLGDWRDDGKNIRAVIGVMLNTNTVDLWEFKSKNLYL